MTAPLTDLELAELDTFLLSEEDDRLPIDEAHGFITALVVSGAVISDEALIEEVCGDAHFGSPGERQRITSLILKMRDEISAVLQSKAPFEPLIIEEEEDGETFEAYEGWCFGFMLGVANQHQKWDTITKDQEELLAPIAQLALLHSGEEDEMDDEEYELCIDLLPGAVNGLHNSWRDS